MTDAPARCKYCGCDISERERIRECKGKGNRLHRFVKTQIPTYESELKQIWISEHPNEYA